MERKKKLFGEEISSCWECPFLMHEHEYFPVGKDGVPATTLTHVFVCYRVGTDENARHRYLHEVTQEQLRVAWIGSIKLPIPDKCPLSNA